MAFDKSTWFTLIFVALILIYFSLEGLRDDVKRAALTETEKATLMSEEKAEKEIKLQLEELRIADRDRLLAIKFSDVPSEDKPTWLVEKAMRDYPIPTQFIIITIIVSCFGLYLRSK